MKINIKKISLLLATLIVIVGCDEDYLEVDSRDDIEFEDSGEVVTPEEMVTGVYGRFTGFSYAFSYLGVSEIISDNSDKGSSPGDTGGDKNLLDDLTHTTSSSSIRAMWEEWYKSIGRATIAIDYTQNYENYDANLKSRLIGEAKFLRALHYFWLVRSFGDVPIQEVDLVERAPESEVYAYIINDLQDAISALPVKSSYAPKDVGRATKGSAQGLLAKVYLYQENWQAAYDAANEVIASNQYDLHPNYAEIWRASTENGMESLFEIQGRGETINHGIQQYSQTQGARGSTGWGWGFNTPSENLLNAFDAAGDDVRRDATIIFRGETLWDGRVVGETENPMYNEKAYSSLNVGDGDGDKNIRVLRYAEILLIQAEAATHINQDAATPLNLVRERVGLAPIAAPTVQQIWNERRLELAMEHDRWFDLNRTGQAAAAMAADGKTFVNGKHELFPIPNDQLIQTPEMVQNPGW
ncbi:RagB/SusD family nutrient uptake outer membrane protein [Gelidibacter salicanalis]|uniref:RagB/SusD family nutrient uptake outer membrane protein n=1 Tax=Gelidibacter salicanalis TaxID=291193 RepID=A0A934KXI5_9FLAO|nr:RagB/SusD family nutrient uptake outer membrane protein [Gelidibacter salicanalis]MBJ7881125.1 RagB/SusD family nutrient uptake outer membrane protein [Gelidibacter salicanalis]